MQYGGEPSLQMLLSLSLRGVCFWTENAPQECKKKEVFCLSPLKLRGCLWLISVFVSG